MRKHLLAGVIALLALGSLAQAQYGPRGIYEPRSVSAIIDRVHADLERGYRQWHISHGDRKRLEHAEHDLRDFAKKWYRGKFDKGELDEAIASIQHVVDNNHLSGRERDALYDDLAQLRAMREAYDRHEIGYGRR
jgi:hypothetical protein